MFKAIQSKLRGLPKLFKKETILFIIILVVLGWALYSYYGSKLSLKDSMATGASANAGQSAPSPVQGVAPVVPAAEAKQNAGYTTQPVANPSELLPNDKNSKWGELNPSAMNQGDVLMPDLLQAGYHIGIDTIGQTLRNANLQLRSDPIISKADIGPWNQSTIEADLARVPLEIGQGPR
uniref:Minor capsid protein P11 C-terminal conserved region domain-containing protein n=1 Tax=viral metagenome TaxID=1070528 RepID=A0A6C0DL16_9ZZZZ